MVLPNIASGGGAIPITGGAATSGPATSGGGFFGPVNVAGLFGTASSNGNGGQMLLHISIGVAVGVILSRMLRRR